MTRRKVLMVDDHVMVREGTRLLLEQLGLDCELLEAGTLRAAGALLTAQADIGWVLLDLGLPDVEGVAALTLLRERHPSTPVVVLSAAEDRSLVLECINQGAAGFIGKSATGAELADALRLVFAGGIYLPPTLFGRSTTEPAPRPQAVLSAKERQLTRLGLTPRQIDVLDLLVQGHANKTIAARMGLAEATVKSHVASALRALNVKNRTQAVFVLAKWRHAPGERFGPSDD